METSQASSGGRWEARLGMNRGLNVLMSSSWALVLGCPLGARAARERKLGEVHISRSWAKAVKWASLAKVSWMQRHSRANSELGVSLGF